MIRSAKLEDRMECLLQRDDITALLKHSYLQVLGSLSEGLPFTVLEANACGIPTIGTKIGGMDEAILDGVTGILVPRYSGKALAEATFHLLDDQQFHDRMGQAAQAHVRQHFDARRSASNLLDIYEVDLAQCSH